MQTLFLLRTCINHVNKYAVVGGAMQTPFYSELAPNHANRYTIVGAMQPLFYSKLTPNHANHYAVVDSIQTLFLFRTCINHINSYAVVGVMQTLFLLRTCINHANRYAVVGTMPFVRTWVITDYLFSLADLPYLPADDIASFYVSCMIIFGFAAFLVSYNFFILSRFNLLFPCFSNGLTETRQQV